MNESRSLPVVLVLLLATLLSGWLLLHAQRGLKPGAPPRPSLPDYRLAHMHVRVFDANGTLRYRLRAQRLVHYPSPERAELNAPLLHWYPHPDAVPWVVRAPNGEVLDRGREVRLLGVVHIDRSASGTRRAVSILTQNLAVWPHRSLARTAARVVVRSAGAELSGVGMRADFTQDRVVLLSDVHGTYVHSRS